MRIKINTILLVLICILYSCPTPKNLTITDPKISSIEEKMNTYILTFHSLIFLPSNVTDNSE